VTPLAGRTILAVLAHPDDESLACGGTLARLADAGARVVLLCASRGELGSASGPERDDVLAHIRTLELREAASSLGIAELLLMDHPDGNLRWAHITELLAQLVMALEHYRPAAVITFGEDGLYWHLDHIGVHERTTTAVGLIGAAAPPLYYVTMPPGVMRAIVDAASVRGWTPPRHGFWSLSPDAFGDSARPHTLAVDVTDWVPRKLAAIRCHRSQMGAGHPFDTIDEAEARRWLGTEHFRRAPTGGSDEPVLETLAASHADLKVDTAY
jgi:LmbE family N-acetylglucosaminyl deacetylase